MYSINNTTSIIKKTNGVRCKLYFKMILVQFDPKRFSHFFVSVGISFLREPFDDYKKATRYGYTVQ